MTRRALNRILLSLLLLISQQMAVAHLMAHWSARAVMTAQAGQEAGKDGTQSRSLAQDRGCDQCMAFAQIASAVGQESRSFVPPCERARAAGPITESAGGARTLRAFHSRAPPVA
jgi:hypothetical protein